MSAYYSDFLYHPPKPRQRKQDSCLLRKERRSANAIKPDSGIYYHYLGFVSGLSLKDNVDRVNKLTWLAA